MAGATRSLSSLRSVIRSIGLAEALACSARRCGSRVSSNGRSASTTARAVGIRSAAGRFRVETVVVTDCPAPARRCRRSSLTEARLGGSARSARRLMLAEFGVQARCGPTDFPVALVADHVQLTVVGPGPVLRQMPGVAVVDRSGVLGELPTRAPAHPGVVACRPAQAALSAVRASSGRSVSCAAPVVSPVASLAKNCSAAGVGTVGRGRARRQCGGRHSDEPKRM